MSSKHCGSNMCSCRDGGPDDGTQPPSHLSGPTSSGLCVKCKAQPAEIVIRKQSALCHECLEAQVILKARAGMRAASAVAPGDIVALALSGGESSSLLLRVAQDMRADDPTKRGKFKVPFSLTVVHIASAKLASVRKVEDALRPLLAPGVSMHVELLENIFADEITNESQRSTRLQDLLIAVRDPTGREDLTEYLRLRLLLDVAARLHCNKLVFGHNAASMAARSIASAAKGRGYALPGDAAHIDSRHSKPCDPVIVYPLREISGEEVSAVARRQGCAVALLHPEEGGDVNEPNGSINALAAAFIEKVLGHNPGAVSNINSTVSKLEDFPWNKPLTEVSTRMERHSGKDEGLADALENLEVLCSLCCAPLADDEVQFALSSDDKALAGLCDSCRHQIFNCYDDEATNRRLLHLLPKRIRQSIELTGDAYESARQALGESPSAAEVRRHITSLLDV